MKFHYAGKYDGDESKLPQREHPENYVPFKEPDIKKLSVIANTGCAFTILALAAVVMLRLHGRPKLENMGLQFILGCVLPMFFLPIHELLHAMVFNISQQEFPHPLRWWDELQKKNDTNYRTIVLAF